MRRMHAVLLVLPFLAGCDALDRVRAENPVAGVAPPRIRMTNEDVGIASVSPNPLVTADATGGDASIRPVVLSQSPDESTDLTGSRTVALVNGTPILASEVLAPYQDQIAQAIARVESQKLTASQQAQAERELQKMRMIIIKRDLPGHIDRVLLGKALRESLKDEQLKMLDEIIGRDFDKEVATLMQQEGVQTRTELELKLRERGRSIAGLKDEFFGQRLAMEYLGYKSQSKLEVGRPDILAYYEDHIADFTLPAKVKWQQLLISFRKHGGKAGAKAELDKAVAELKSGADFGEVVRKHSNGLHAESGGHFGWTEADSLANADVQRALFELPIGSMSRVIEDDASFQIVKVADRQEARRKPFAEVQDEIRQTLEKERRRELARTVIDELRASAEIVTIFDEKPPTATAGR